MIEQKTLEQMIRDLWNNTKDTTDDWEQEFMNALEKTVMEHDPDCMPFVHIYDSRCDTIINIIDFIGDCTRNYRTIEQFACVDDSSSECDIMILVCITKQEF